MFAKWDQKANKSKITIEHFQLKDKNSSGNIICWVRLWTSSYRIDDKGENSILSCRLTLDYTTSESN